MSKERGRRMSHHTRLIGRLLSNGHLLGVLGLSGLACYGYPYMRAHIQYERNVGAMQAEPSILLGRGCQPVTSPTDEYGHPSEALFIELNRTHIDDECVQIMDGLYFCSVSDVPQGLSDYHELLAPDRRDFIVSSFSVQKLIKLLEEMSILPDDGSINIDNYDIFPAVIEDQENYHGAFVQTQITDIYPEKDPSKYNMDEVKQYLIDMYSFLTEYPDLLDLLAQTLVEDGIVWQKNSGSRARDFIGKRNMPPRVGFAVTRQDKANCLPSETAQAGKESISGDKGSLAWYPIEYWGDCLPDLGSTLGPRESGVPHHSDR